MSDVSKQIYCSLDIETTGFDPLTEEVLEVGFAMFKVTGSGVKIVEEWTQVFKPGKEVSPQILGLTGITAKELETAPAFAEHRDFIQKKLQDAVIVGHNIAFDIKFLEAFGIKFSGKSIDTLDLVQWLLPTHHSYNLENLMHTFGISHKEAHRALADSKAALKLLEKLLGLFAALPEQLQSKIKKIAAAHKFLWAELLSVKIKPFRFPKESAAKQKAAAKQKNALALNGKTFYNFALEDDITQIVSSSVSGKTLLVLPNSHGVLDLYKRKLADAAVFLPDQMFDEKKFSALQKLKKITPEQAKFILKILVWQETNWQTICLLDLNLSFFGGQFKSLVSGGQIKKADLKNIVAADMPTFLESDPKIFKDYKIIIHGLSEFETAITSGISTKVSWGYLNYLIKTYYNPELNSGNEKFKQAAADALAASDLFFGLVSALLRTEGQAFEYIKINQELDSSERWNKVKAAAENFEQKMLFQNQIFQSKELEKFVNQLQAFFKDESNRVKWIELAENRCVLFSMPLDISELVADILARFKQVTFVDSLDEDILPGFFLRRLGLKDFSMVRYNFASPSKLKQGDLFFSIKKKFGKKTLPNITFVEASATEANILEVLGKKNPWPAAVLFSSPVQVKEFYEKNYERLKQRAALLAQTAYGGSNKILRNFGINKNSLMLVADKFILKSINQNSGAAQNISKIRVKNLVLCRLPFDQFTHPYQEAVSSSLPNAFEDYALPKAFYNFHSIIKLFYTPELENIYVIDAKLSKSYAKIFKEYGKLLN